MVIKSTKCDHSQDGFHSALGINKDIVVMCRERILFCHFSNALQSIDLFGDKENAPRELTTVTGHLHRCLNMISDPLEYEVTLLHFMNFHRLAQEAFAHWEFENDPKNTSADKLKLQVMKLVMRLKDESSKDDQDSSSDDDSKINSDINLDSIMERIDIVKKSKHNFPKYLELLGITPNKNFDDIDKMINGLFD